ncbi:MAG TPA: glycosyltransferase [Cyclobacteriaceae bacterium]
MKILMFGWEFPPKHTGGIGVACRGITNALADEGHDVTFVVPNYENHQKPDNISLIDASNIKDDVYFEKEVKDIVEKIEYITVASKIILPYITEEEFKTIPVKTKEERKRIEKKALSKVALSGTYGKRLLEEVSKYSLITKEIVMARQDFDVIHAHDWMCLQAGVVARQVLKIPLIAHIHTIEKNRSMFSPNQMIADMEKALINKADVVVTVSEMMKKVLINHYEVDESKISVLHNAIDTNDLKRVRRQPDNNSKNVLFLGRLAPQKGIITFLDIARGLISRNDKINFIVAGDGPMKEQVEQKIKNQNMRKMVKLVGHVNREGVKRLLSGADLLIMPSLSEPYGIAAMEAAFCKVPTLISKNAGVTEVLPHIKSIDYWDIFHFVIESEKILYNGNPLKRYIRDNHKTVKSMTWGNYVKKLVQLYDDLLSNLT